MNARSLLVGVRSRSLLAGLAALALFLPLLAPAQATTPARPSLESLFDDPVLAQGGGVKVTSSQLERAFIAYRATAAARGQRISEDSRLRHEAQLLDRIIITQILTNRASPADVALALTNAARYLEEAAKNAGSDEALRRQLMATGVRLDQFQARAHEEALADAVLERELKSTITVTDAEVTEFYRTGTDLLVKTMQADLDKMAADPASKPAQVAALRERIEAVRRGNLNRLEQPEKVRLAHLFQATRDRKAGEDFSPEQRRIKQQFLEKLRARAVAGEDFMKLVQEFSEDPSLAETKGEYTLTRNAPFSPEFKAAAFSLEVGKISDVVVTPYGMHLIKVLEKIPPRKTDFDKVSKELRDVLHAQAVQKAMPAYFTKLKKDAAVKILDPKFEELLAEPSAPRAGN